MNFGTQGVLSFEANQSCLLLILKAFRVFNRFHLGQADDVHYTRVFNWTIKSDRPYSVNGIGFGGKNAEFIIWRNTGKSCSKGNFTSLFMDCCPGVLIALLDMNLLVRILACFAGTEMIIKTPVGQRRPLLLRTFEDFFFAFQVRACRYITIFLTALELRGIGDFYEIEIARHGNEVVIRDLVSDSLGLHSCLSWYGYTLAWVRV